MKTGKVLTICSVLFLLALFAGQASAAKYGHNFDAGPVALDAIDSGGTTLDCNNCHLQSHSDTGAVQFVPTGDIVYDRCFQCHSATGGAANTVIGNHTSTGVVDCGYCHQVHDIEGGKIASTDNHANTTPLAGQPKDNIKYIRKDMTKYVPGASTNTVYQQATTHFAFASSDADSGHFNGVCQSCHENPVQHHTVPFTDDHQITKADPSDNATWTSTNCKECHQHVYTPSTAITNPPAEYDAFKPWHNGTQFVSNANCELCHGTGEVVKDIHNNNCDLCHTAGIAKSAATLKAGDSFTTDPLPISPAGTAVGGTIASSCTDCHSGLFHGLTIASVTNRHQLSSDTSGGYDCEACHFTDAANEQLNTHMPAFAGVNDCLVCHENNTAAAVSGGITPKSVVDAATFNDPYVNTNDTKCEECHAVKGDFKRHGLTDNTSGGDSIMDTAGNNTKHHNFLNGGSTGEAVTYTGALNSAKYGGIKVTRYNCGDCHGTGASRDNSNGNTKPFTSAQTTQVHTAQNGTGSGNCLTCHLYTGGDVQTQIANFQGTPGSGITCETCHKAANDPATPADNTDNMSQYDGLRHHTTLNSQAGNCTYCHADPRPASVDDFNTGYAWCADNAGANNFDDGWETDYSTVCPSVPKQPACALCHTNSMTYSINVSSGTTHGYNISGGTAAQRTTGFTAWKNTYDNVNGVTLSGNSNRTISNVDPVVQTLAHRIDNNPGTGTALIKPYNLGACLGCHTIQYMHAAPLGNNANLTAAQSALQSGIANWQDYTVSLGSTNTIPWDVLRNAPGRHVFNLQRGPGTDPNNDGEYNDHSWSNDKPCKDNNCENRGKDCFKDDGCSNDMENSRNNGWWNAGNALGETSYTTPTSVQINAINNYEGLGTGQIVIFPDITVPTVAGVVDIITLDTSVDEGVGTVTITARRSSGTNGAVTATVTATGTATIGGGDDYTLSSTTFSWANGNSADKTITITVNDDSSSESDETIVLTITGTTGGLTIGTNDSVTTTIVDNDGTSANGTVNITTADSSCAEEVCGAITITANRTGGSSGAVTASVQVSGTAIPGVDYTLSSNAFFWADGEGGNKTITLTVVDDAYVEPDETAIITITSTTGGLAIGPDPSVTITITNTDINGPGTLQISTPDASVPENVGTVNITCTRTGGDIGAVSATVSSAGSTAGGSDYSYAPATCSWGDGDAADKTVVLTINDDVVPAEPNETVVLTLVDGGALNGAVIGANNSVTTTIVDNDVPGEFDYTQVNYSVQENGTSITLYVSRTGGTFGAVSVQYNVTGGTAVRPGEYDIPGGYATGTLNWANGDSANKAITVTVVDDLVVDGNKTVTLNLINPTGGASVGTTNPTTTLTITDNENNAPVCGADTYSMSHGSALTNLTVMSNDNDGGDGGALSLTGVSATSNGGTAVLNGNSVDYTPSGAYVGDETFSYNLFDTFTTVACPVTVTLTNAAPVVTGETASIDVSTSADIEVLSNDTDPDGDDLRVLTASVSAGSCTINTSFPTSYVTPPAAQNINITTPGTPGSCTIDYTVEDEFGATTAGAVAVTVNPPDQITACQANWTPGSSTPALNITENFNGAGDRAAAVFSQGWTAGSDYTGTKAGNNCWWTEDGTTGSGSTGLTNGNPAPYVYVEASDGAGTPDCGNYGNGDAFWLESPAISAATYSTTLTLAFDWNYESNQGGDSSIDVYACDGGGCAWPAGWTLVQNITNSDRGTTAAWTSTGNINLNGALNSDSSRVRIVVTRGGTDYRHDIVFDNINLSGTAPAGPATLDVLAANTAGLSSPVTATYNSVGNAMNHVAGTQWQLVSYSNSPSTDTYVTPITITSTGDPTGMTCPVINNGGPLSWPTIAITYAKWDGVDTVDVWATSTWNDQDQLSVTYDGSTVDMTWSVANSRWEHAYTGYGSFVAGNATVTSGAATNSPQVQAVVANQPPVVTGETATVSINTTTDIEVLSNDTDPDGDDIRILSATATCGTINTSFPTAYVTPPTAQNINYTAPGTGGSCTINYTVEDTYGVTTGGSVAITVNTCTDLAVLNDWSTLYNGGTEPVTQSYTPGAGSDRLLLVAVTHEDASAGGDTYTWNVRYGGATGTSLTPIEVNNGGRANSWMGYLLESDITAEGATANIYVAIGGNGFNHDAIEVHAITFENVNQTTPIINSGSGNSVTTSVNTINTGALSWFGNDMAIYAATHNSGTTHTPQGNLVEDLQVATTNSTSVGKSTTTTATTETLTVNFGASSRASIIGAAVQSVCNSNTPPVPPQVEFLAPISGTETVNTTNDSGNFTYEIGAGSNRLLVVSIFSADTGGSNQTTNNMSATYGGVTLTQIAETTNSGDVGIWMGYLNESQIAGRANDTVTFNNGDTGFDYTMVQVMAFTGIKQSAPIADSDVDQSDINNASGSSTVGSFTWAQYDMPIYAAGTENNVAHSTPANFTQEHFVSNTTAMSSGYRNDNATTGGTGTISVTHNNELNAMIGVILKADVN